MNFSQKLNNSTPPQLNYVQLAKANEKRTTKEEQRFTIKDTAGTLLVLP